MSIKHPTLAQLAFPLALTAVLTPLLAIGACASDFDPGSYLGSLRLMGIEADLPIAHPGETVALEALFSNRDALPLEWAWATCTEPASSTPESCFEALDPDSRVEGVDLSQHAVTIPEDILENVAEDSRDAVFLGVVAVLCPGQLVEGDTRGVPFACEDESGRRLELHEFQVGFRRIRVREEDRNANPVIEGLTWQGESWGANEIPEVDACGEDSFAKCPAEQRYEVSALVDEPEEGTDEFGSEFHEQQIVQYYATHGRFEYEVRIGSDSTNRWVATDTLSGDVVTLYAVVRDDRGGLAFTSRRLRVR